MAALLNFYWHVLCFLVGAALVFCLHIRLFFHTPLVQLGCVTGEAHITVQELGSSHFFCHIISKC